ncbi:ABC transporter C family member 14-like [Abrus precatorius]|uniref:ABC-type xenobiotic transporter n=1 Tax=Abrus precatorius TaxID=3816 RepID=A0A8B8LAT9_ABRPR|nr:ABC transporter C family member 14-like [Abrus precatorius]XP_027351874.1 ABC transporter C family member 14-like [Abrus precatorius]
MSVTSYPISYHLNLNMSSSLSWLTSPSCSPLAIDSSSSSSSQLLAQWLRFIFLSPCPQRLILSAIDFIFLVFLLAFAAQKLYSRFTSNVNSTSTVTKPLLQEKDSDYKVTLWFKLSFLVTTLLAVAYTVLGILALTQSNLASWKLIEAQFRFFQAVAYIVIVILLVHEKKFKASKHPLSLRIYWTANLAIACLFAASAIVRMVTVDETRLELSLRVDDIFSLINLPLSLFLFIVSITGSSGIQVIRISDVVGRTNQWLSSDRNLSPYAYAPFFSKVVWFWMNPLLSKGYKSPLKLDDVPTLPPGFRAEKMSEIFQGNWPKPEENSKHPVGLALFRCFWKHIVFTGLLASMKLAVMYVGPTLIQSFVDYTSMKNSTPSEGVYLIAILFLAKSVEVLSVHQFNFHSQKLGMLIRSSIITSVYKKALRLSSSSRQAHGTGQIVNHMAVDAQQLSDLMMQFHPIWMMPLQVGAALALIYSCVGLSVLAALLGTTVVFLFTLFRTKKTNTFQFRIMKSRDLRMKATNELLNNMRVIKFQAWEEYFGNKIAEFRKAEHGWIGKFLYYFAINMGILSTAPLTITVLTFGSATLMGIRLNPGTVFTITSVIKILQEPVRTFPQALMLISQALISLGRLDEFMMSKEMDDNAVKREDSCNGDIALEIKDGKFSWDDKDGNVALSVDELVLKKGDHAAIVGTVGSGKSSLLASVLGEMFKISGKVRVCGKIAYVAQTSWIQNATIQDNILFGLPMNREKYREVIKACCLEKDLEMMDYGDQTEIGERGINLSGGQKQRVQLARAVYHDCDIYLLDDVFSAVDAQTGSYIFKECIMGALKNKTILLVTHQVDFLHNVDSIMVMRDGRIVQNGKYDELLKAGLDFGALVAAHESSIDIAETSDEVGVSSAQSPKLARIPSKEKESNGEMQAQDESKSDKTKANLIEEEERETGRVNLQVYKHYFTEAFGWWGVALMLGMSLTWIISFLIGDYWLAIGTAEDSGVSPPTFIIVYAVIAVVVCIVVMCRSLLFTYWGLKTSQSFFTGMLQSILHAPMSFFDTTPSGRILSRVSTDILWLDISIPMLTNFVMVAYFSLISILFVTCQTAWETVFLLIPLFWLNNFYRKYFLASSRELTRLDSITKAPVIHHFSETLAGVMTIRGFRKQSAFSQENIDRVNASLRMDFHNNGANEWLGFRLDYMGVIFLCISTIFMIFLPSAIVKPEYVGLSLSYGLALSSLLSFTISMTCSVENKMVSVERIKQFTNLTPEAPWKIADRTPPENWPSQGSIELNNLQVRYRPNTPLILKGISLNIEGGEKIGVVGRTGSGKSTLIQVLFRLIEPSAGKIIVDGINICTVGLHDLRSRLGIIPQEPVLFQGTVRSNIDPLGLYSEEEIWKSLERCQLKEVVASKPEKLEASVVDGGDNWSVGQRQLLCLGRIMLKRSKILFMDEATASVDSQTDALIQKIIREDFAERTIISIAHRIPTVMDCDRVLVIDGGFAKEFDKPSRLLEKPSLFGALVKEYSNRSA